MQRLFSTETGYVGSGPKKLQHGDILCILFGCPLPLVMRIQTDKSYGIVGAAYVHGIMNGEFLRDKESYTDVDFLIS
jgi:hypothetical protein